MNTEKDINLNVTVLSIANCLLQNPASCTDTILALMYSTTFENSYISYKIFKPMSALRKAAYVNSNSKDSA